jgi:hypothetical protein
MGKFLKATLLPLLLVSILLLALPAGCSTSPSQEELNQILDDSMTAMNSVSSGKMTGNLEMAMELSGAGEDGTVEADMTMEGAIDLAKIEMQLAINASFTADMTDTHESMDNITLDLYIVDDHMYLKMGIPGMGEEWMKMPVPDASMAGFDIDDMFEQQLAMLESYVELEYLRTEKVDGSDCYVIQMVPDLAAMMDWIAEMGMTEMGMTDMGSEWDEIQSVIEEVINEMFEEFSYIVWIDKDTKYIKKMTASIKGNISSEDFEGIGEDFGDISEEFGEITIEVSMDMDMYDYNEPVNIVLPEEAQDAMDMGEFGF